MNGKLKIAATAIALTFGATANATIVTVFDGIANGVADFDSTVTSAGATVNADIWSGISSSSNIARTDYTITQNDGGTGFINTYGSMSGQVISIDPATTAAGGSNPRTDPMDYFNSGITFTFNSAVNAVGFEVGDWATCCSNPVTDLFMSFDGGAPILVASANQTSDGLFPSQNSPTNSVYEIFVAAFDDSGDFTSVSFWGNGLGEVLYAGGQVRYALLDQGSLPNGSVPVPAPLALMGLGLLGLSLRKRQAA